MLLYNIVIPIVKHGTSVHRNLIPFNYTSAAFDEHKNNYFSFGKTPVPTTCIITTIKKKTQHYTTKKCYSHGLSREDPADQSTPRSVSMTSVCFETTIPYTFNSTETDYF